MHHPVTACSIPSSWSDPEEARLARRRSICCCTKRHPIKLKILAAGWTRRDWGPGQHEDSRLVCGEWHTCEPVLTAECLRQRGPDR